MRVPEITSDELERVRLLSREIQKWDRRRRWRAGAAALMVSLGIVLVAMAADLWLRGFLPNLLNAGNLPAAGFLLGVLLGVTVGLALHGLVYGVAVLLRDPFRNERLLVKYYESLLRLGPGARAAERLWTSNLGRPPSSRRNLRLLSCISAGWGRGYRSSASPEVSLEREDEDRDPWRRFRGVLHRARARQDTGA